MLPFSYEDRFPDHNAMSGYAVTNEEPLLIRANVKPFNNGLAIASGGEVTFLSLLAKTRHSLVLVDHSYSSLRTFCIKALLLATIGPDATRKLLVETDIKEWSAAVGKVVEHLPSTLRTASDILHGAAYDIRREWHYADKVTLRRACHNLHKIKLIHGDLLDAADRAPYDFIYLSNALEHTCRPTTLTVNKGGFKRIIGNHPDPTVLSTKLLKKGSRVLWVQAQGQAYGSNAAANVTWPTTFSLRGYRTSWTYNLGQLPLTPKKG